MRIFYSLLIAIFCLTPVRAATTTAFYKYTLTITSVPPVSATLSADGDMRRFTNNTPADASKFLQTTNTLQATATNLYQHLLSYGITNINAVKAGTNNTWTPTNTLVLEAMPDHFVTFTSLSNWVSITIATNTVTSGWLGVRVPLSNEVSGVRTQIASGLIHALNDSAPTNTVSATAPAFTNLIHAGRVSQPPVTNLPIYASTFTAPTLVHAGGTADFMLGRTNTWDYTTLSNAITIAVVGATTTGSEMRWVIDQAGNWFSMSASSNGALGTVFSLYTPAGRTLFNYFSGFGLFVGDNLTPVFVSDLDITNMLDVFSATIHGGNLTGAVVVATSSADFATATVHGGTITGSVIAATSAADLTGATIHNGNTTNTAIQAGNIYGPIHANSGELSNATISATAAAVGSLIGTNMVAQTLLGSNATIDAILLHAGVLQATNITGSNWVSGALHFQFGTYSSLVAGTGTTNAVALSTNTVTVLSGNADACLINSLSLPESGLFHITINGSSFNHTFVHQSGFESTQAKRLFLPGAANMTIPPAGAALWIYNAAAGYWYLLSPQPATNSIARSTEDFAASVTNVFDLSGAQLKRQTNSALTTNLTAIVSNILVGGHWEFYVTGATAGGGTIASNYTVTFRTNGITTGTQLTHLTATNGSYDYAVKSNRWAKFTIDAPFATNVFVKFEEGPQ